MIAVLGAGAWGTALALLLARNGSRVSLWTRDAEAAGRLDRDRENQRYLPRSHLSPRSLARRGGAGGGGGDSPTRSWSWCRAMRSGTCSGGWRTPRRTAAGVTWATKGIDPDSGRWLHEVAVDALGTAARAAVVSGPTFADEVAGGAPRRGGRRGCRSRPRPAARRASPRSPLSRLCERRRGRGIPRGARSRTCSRSPRGVADGLGLGANTRAAIVSRGLGEMLRLGRNRGCPARDPDGARGTRRPRPHLHPTISPATGDSGSPSRRETRPMTRGRGWVGWSRGRPPLPCCSPWPSGAGSTCRSPSRWRRW